MEIHQETNYKKFKYITGNREVSKKKVTKIIESYNSGINLFPYCPVLINQDFHVIDGQHRIAACETLKIPVYYIVVPDLTLQQIAEINSNTDKWKNSDFMSCYTKIGNENYKILSAFKEKYQVNLSVAISLLMDGYVAKGGSNLMEIFRNGKFIVRHREKAEKLIQMSLDYASVFDQCTSRDFIDAIRRLSTSSLYNHNEVVAKLIKEKLQIEQKRNSKEYIYHIEELFNHKNQHRKFIYNGPAKTA